MGILCNSWRGGLASADGPDGLVGDNNVGPVLDGAPHGVELLLEDVICLIGLPLL